jgi:hypothetical protein
MPFGVLRVDGSEKPAAMALRTAGAEAIHSLWPSVAPAPPEEPEPQPDPWAYWPAERIAAITNCPLAAVTENWPKLHAQLVLCGIDDRPTQAAMVATVAIETARTFAPVREAFWLSEEWRKANLRYYPYYGRGYIQLTWPSNYEAFGRKVDELWQAGGAINLLSKPDDALDPDISAAVSAVYFRDHGGDGQQRIPEAARRGDWREVRRLVQGADAGLSELTAMATALLSGAPPAPVDEAEALRLALRTLRDSTLPALRAQLDEADRIVRQFVGER